MGSRWFECSRVRHSYEVWHLQAVRTIQFNLWSQYFTNRRSFRTLSTKSPCYRQSRLSDTRSGIYNNNSATLGKSYAPNPQTFLVNLWQQEILEAFHFKLPKPGPLPKLVLRSQRDALLQPLEQKSRLVLLKLIHHSNSEVISQHRKKKSLLHLLSV